MITPRRLLDTLAVPLQGVYSGCGLLAATALVTLALLVLLSVFSRLLGMQVVGVTSYATYALSASWFLALAYTFGKGGHIRVNLLIGRLQGRAKWWAELWCLSIAVAIALTLAYYAYDLAYISWLIQERSQAADATLLWIPQTGMVLGTAVLALALVEKWLRLVFLGETHFEADTSLAEAKTPPQSKDRNASPS